MVRVTNPALDVYVAHRYPNAGSLCRYRSFALCVHYSDMGCENIDVLPRLYHDLRWNLNIDFVF